MSVCKRNVSRYVRDEISGRQIANFTLTDVKGAYLKNVVRGLVASFGADGYEKEAEKVQTFGRDEGCNYQMLKMLLDNGRPFVFAIECLPAFGDHSILEYSGEVSKCLHGNVRPDKVKNRSYHAVLGVGIKPRNGSIPPMLLVQDSCLHRPFFSIGLDLLMDMGMDDLDFNCVPRRWRFNEQKEYVMSPDTRSLICGLPMSFNNGVVVVEEPVVERRDVSRYVDEVKYEDGVEELWYEV